MRLELQNVSFGYDPRHPLQSNLTFTVETGEICCVLGPNGCGKSTLFKAILGVLPITRGKITIDNADLSRYGARKLSQYLSFVAQTHDPPFPYKVRDVVMLGRANRVGYLRQPTAKDYQIAEQAMHDLGIFDLRDRVYTDLSGGQLQLVLIARALVQQPSILMLDEPAAALDFGNAVRVLSIVKKLSELGYGVLMTTHSPDHAFLCDAKVVLLQKDGPCRSGRAVDVVTERTMRASYGVDVKVVEFVSDTGIIVRRCSPQM